MHSIANLSMHLIIQLSIMQETLERNVVSTISPDHALIAERYQSIRLDTSVEVLLDV